MVEVVGGVGVPHTPHFPRIVDQREPPGLAREIARLYGEVARQLRALDPDVLVVFTADHYNTFFVSSLPVFSIGVAPSAAGPSDYPELPRHRVPIAAALARRLQAHLVRAEFDVGVSQEFEFDHPVTVPLHFLTPRMDVPVVPVFIGALCPPLPPARRCLALGAAIRAALETDPDLRLQVEGGRGGRSPRVAALASGSFSLEIGGPRISDHSHTGVPAPAWFERVLGLLRAGRVGQLVEEATEQRLAEAGNAGGELLLWIAMLGMLGPSAPCLLEAQPEFGHAYGAWSQDRRQDHQGRDQPKGVR